MRTPGCHNKDKLPAWEPTARELIPKIICQNASMDWLDQAFHPRGEPTHVLPCQSLVGKKFASMLISGQFN